MAYVRIYWVLFGFNLVIAFSVFFWMPDYRHHFIYEDQLVENLSGLFFFISFAVGFFFFLKSHHHRKLLFVVSTIGMLGFLDEISYGERLLWLDMPYIGGVKIDAAHDIFYLGFKIISGLSFTQSLVFFLLVASSGVFIAVAYVKYQHVVKSVIRKNQLQQALPLLCIFALLIFFALVIDLELIEHEFLMMIEELFEMNAAIALLLCAMSLHDSGAFRQ